MKPNEIHSGGIKDPRSKIAEGSFPIQNPARMNFIRFHSVSFGRVLDPRLLGKAPQQSWILDLGSCPNEFHIQDLPRMKPNEIHSGGIQDPRSKIAEGSFPVILDPELCLSVCMYVCMYVYIYIHICLYVWCGVVRYATVRYGTVWYGMVWHGMVWYGMVWYVGMYVCTYVCMYVCMYKMYVCMYVMYVLYAMYVICVVYGMYVMYAMYVCMYVMYAICVAYGMYVMYVMYVCVYVCMDVMYGEVYGKHVTYVV